MKCTIARSGLLALSLLLSAATAARASESSGRRKSAGKAPPSAAKSADTNSDLLRAYEKEFAFLQAQRASLKKRIAEAEEQQRANLARAQSEVDTLQGRVVGRTVAADRAEDALREAERNVSQAEESSERVASAMSQSKATLQAAGVALPDTPKDPSGAAAYLRTSFAKATELISHQSGVHRERGRFYLVNGRQVDGTIIRIGAVAAYGVSKSGSGALAPAGGGMLKLWQTDASGSAHALLDGTHPAALKLFLYESVDKPVEERPTQTVVQFIQSGGVIAWVIVGLGLIALVMVVLRTIILVRASAKARRIVDRVAPMVEQGRCDEALSICQPNRGAIARVLAAVIRNLNRDRAHLEDIVSEAVLHEAPHIERFGSAITVCAAVAPLLGLLGTVTGMIATFDVITEHGTGDPKLLSGGISVALVTTELGLMIAIPALLLGSLLSSRGEALLARMERAALRIMNLADRRPAAAEPAKSQVTMSADTEPDGQRNFVSVGPLHGEGSLS